MPDENPCDICSDTPDECPSCNGDGVDGGGYICCRCDGGGSAHPEHCCDCGGSPYCVKCHTCGASCAGDCRCPIEVKDYDGKTVKVL